MVYLLSCICATVLYGTFVGHQTLLKTDCSTPPVYICCSISMAALILIAEDNPAVRSALRSILQASGPWDLVDAVDGNEALAKAQELKPNLIILDLVMPVLDGLKTARQLSELLPNTPVLMHTMHSSSQVELEAQKVGVRKVISKSDTQLLISTVQEMLSGATAPGIQATKLPTDIPAPLTAPPAPVLEATAEASENGVESSKTPGDVPPRSQPN